MNRKYRRNKQEEGKNTFNGLRHSQHMFFWRLLEVILFVVIIVSFIIMVQSKVEGNSFGEQAHQDRVSMMGGSSGNFSMCDMTHSCPSKK